MQILVLFIVFVANVASVELVNARQLLDERTHHYEKGENITLWASKVGPISNPSETYRYYQLPYCKPNDVEYKDLSVGELVDANRMESTTFQLNFNTPKQNVEQCTVELNSDQLDQFRQAIEDQWYFQMYYDDLPVMLLVGEQQKSADGQPHAQLNTHFDFKISYNGDQVIEIQAAQGQQPVDIDSVAKGASLKVTFTYSVQWEATNTAYENRLDIFSTGNTNINLEVHWFAIINSSITVLLLTGFLATILMRVLKNDVVRFSREDDALDEEETGWKHIHGDVFRFPHNKLLFCSLIGVGYQLLCMLVVIFIMALIGVYYPYNRGAVYSSLITFYVLTGGIGSYTSSLFFKQMGGSKWVRCVLVTGTIFFGPFVCVFAYVNTVATWAQSTAALPASTIAVITLLWLFLVMPLTVFGGILGKNTKREFSTSCRTNKFPREVPVLPLFRSAVPQMIMAGLLPFSGVYMELSYIFQSVWGHKVLVIWSILAIVFVILIIVTAFVTIALTYFQLAVEDHRWWWRSFLCGGSSGIFIYVYSIYYLVWRSSMSGVLQSSFFLGYMLMVCYGCFILLGTVGWRASLTFVRAIYRAIKCE